MHDFLYNVLYSRLLPILKWILQIVAVLAFPIFIGSIIIRLIFIIIRKPLPYKNMPIVGVIIAFILGFGICIVVPFLKTAELDLIKSIPNIDWAYLFNIN